MTLILIDCLELCEGQYYDEQVFTMNQVQMVRVIKQSNVAFASHPLCHCQVKKS